ncbi:hypothetical protein [Methanogenium cariaci]|uniref:hypothetical protein n=1 Tax=Methanogenium cariaci TaxID=2197 RepID=UPI001FDFB470|nr:hypothetical protein [Methanogenium cariaci]
MAYGFETSRITAPGYYGKKQACNNKRFATEPVTQHACRKHHHKRTKEIRRKDNSLKGGHLIGKFRKHRHNSIGQCHDDENADDQ